MFLAKIIIKNIDLKHLSPIYSHFSNYFLIQSFLFKFFCSQLFKIKHMEIIQESLSKDLKWKNFSKQYFLQEGSMGSYFKFHHHNDSSQRFTVLKIKYNRKKINETDEEEIQVNS